MSDDEQLSTIGSRVLAVRQKRGLSQGQLAALVPGLSPQSIDQIEQGRVDRPRSLPEIAEALGVSETWLRSGKGPDGAPPARAPARAEDVDLMHDVVAVLERTLAENDLRLDERTRKQLAHAFYELMLHEEALARAAQVPVAAAPSAVEPSVPAGPEAVQRRERP